MIRFNIVLLGWEGREEKSKRGGGAKGGGGRIDVGGGEKRFLIVTLCPITKKNERDV